MFTRAIIVAAVVALAAAHDKRYDNEYHHEVEYKENPYDKAYDDAFEHYAHEAKEDRRGLGYGETWEDNFERRNVRLRWLSFILLILTRACSTTSLQFPSR